MRIFGKGKCKLIANCANFGIEGKCKFIANFSATMVTSLPSISLSLSLSICIFLSLSLSHRKYLTHNIGSASALPIMLRDRYKKDLKFLAFESRRWLSTTRTKK